MNVDATDILSMELLTDEAASYFHLFQDLEEFLLDQEVLLLRLENVVEKGQSLSLVTWTMKQEHWLELMAMIAKGYW